MSADDGSVKNTLGSESSGSSASCGDGGGGRRKKEYGRKDRKTVRILTVIAYILCVSLAAVLLSAYYVFLWNPGPIPEKPSRPPQHFQKRNTPYPYMGHDPAYEMRYPPRPMALTSQFGSGYYGNTRPYSHRQIPTPLPLLMTTHHLTTLPQGVPTEKPTTTSPTPPFFKLKLNPMV